MKRAMDRDSSPSSHSTSSSESRSKSADKVGEYEDESEGDEPEEDEPEEDAPEGGDADDTVGTKRRKRRKGRRRSEKLYVDMYKVFDGSAMLALGDYYNMLYSDFWGSLALKECSCRNILRFS